MSLFKLSQFRRQSIQLTQRISNSIRNHGTSSDNAIRIVEVGPRDGLQNEPKYVETDVKIEFINRLSKVGFQNIEVTSFVSPKWIPQFKDSSEVFQRIEKDDSISYPVLVPNIKGFEAAIAGGVKEIAIFAAASETFSQKNINCSIEESINRFRVVAEAAKKANVKIRGYVSTVVGCPYEGPIQPTAVAKVTEDLLKLGCYEISLGDTIGVGSIAAMNKMLIEVKTIAKPQQLAIHCHNTYGQALPNILCALNHDIRVIDSAVSGLGGCPYAKGASGNVPTEDVIYMLNGLGLHTGIDLPELVMIGRFICSYLGRKSESKVTLALGDSKPSVKHDHVHHHDHSHSHSH
ncbi:hydroxymethylglutaryl-CoA lyase, mitochondrial [Contarinia nasturtii]|uniref:hydroxymethylglutaryl-CoA lyase, mitochondrial n=1 Tax=Contarinia nasturtii TaxID=265458 RepID=UPI0012D47931|nr:hydroxymethylglutaryl-CoA lyase, mitochondrial [Contarinia nasturtii]